MQLFRRQNREAFGQIEPHLIAEHRARACSGAVPTVRTVVEHMLEKVEIGAHRDYFPGRFVLTPL